MASISTAFWRLFQAFCSAVKSQHARIDDSTESGEIKTKRRKYYTPLFVVTQRHIGTVSLGSLLFKFQLLSSLLRNSKSRY